MNRFYPHYTTLPWVLRLKSSTVSSRSRRPLVFAHRGGSALAPENTIAAFDNGLSARRRRPRARRPPLARRRRRRAPRPHARSDDESSRGGRRVHGRRAGARGCRLSLPARRGVSVSRTGIGVPTLADVLARYRDVPIVIELKVNMRRSRRATSTSSVAPGRSTASASDRSGCASSARSRALAPAIATSAAREEVRWALYRSWCRWPVSRVAYAGYQVPERAGRTRVVSPRFVAHAHRAGLGVQVWTVDDERGRAPAARLGRRRADHRPTGPDRARRRAAARC